MAWLNRVTPNVDSLSRRTEKHRQWAADNRNYAASEFAKLGGAQTDVDRRVNQSLNAAFAEQEVGN